MDDFTLELLAKWDPTPFCRTKCGTEDFILRFVSPLGGGMEINMSELFLKLLNMSITASWLVLAVIVLRLLLKKAPKAIVCVLWALVGIRLLCPISVESVLSLIPSAETVPQNIVYTDEPTIHTGIAAFNTLVNPVLSETFAPKPAASVNPMQTIVSVASVVWLCGMAAMLVYGAVSYVRVYRKVRASIAREDGVRICDEIEAPFIFGIFRPRIYLPSAIDDGDIAYVIAHERAHIARRDHLWKPLGFALLTVYWFNPVLWVAYILLCRDIELACDERVLKTLGTEAKKPYSDALINCSEQRRIISACPLAFGEIGVRERVKGILNYKKPAFWIIVVALLLCAVVAVCFLTNPIGEDEKAVLGGSPLTFDADEHYTFYPVELTYACSSYSFVMTADAAPDYTLRSDMTFSKREMDYYEPDEFIGSTIELGTMTEITLTEENFDACFDASGKDAAAQLRKNNRRAWELRCVEKIVVSEMQYLYMLLEQKDGTYYVGVGYYNYGTDGGNLIRWLYRTDKSTGKYDDSIGEIGHMDGSGYKVYSFTESVDQGDPSIYLYDDMTFSFGWSLFSSYIAHGAYTLTEDTLTLATYDGLYTYVFDVVDDTFVFDASGSSRIPSYRYSGDAAEAECPVPDGAVFRFVKRNAIYSGR